MSPSVITDLFGLRAGCEIKEMLNYRLRVILSVTTNYNLRKRRTSLSHAGMCSSEGIWESVNYISHLGYIFVLFVLCIVFNLLNSHPDL